MLRNAFTPPCGFDLMTTTVDSPEGLAAIAFWGYRLVVHPDGTFFVHETYYDDREGVLGIAREPARPCGLARPLIQVLATGTVPAWCGNMRGCMVPMRHT